MLESGAPWAAVVQRMSPIGPDVCFFCYFAIAVAVAVTVPPSVSAGEIDNAEYNSGREYKYRVN
jgi:hypothetical protein